MMRFELADAIRQLVADIGHDDLLEVVVSWPAGSTPEQAQHFSRYHWRIEVRPRHETDPEHDR